MVQTFLWGRHFYTYATICIMKIWTVTIVIILTKKIISSCKGGEIGSKSKHDLSILIVESWMDKENGQFKKNEYNGEAVFES